MGKSCRKIFQENIAGNSCEKFLQEILVGNAVGNLVGNLEEKVLIVCNGSKNGKKHQHRQFFTLAGNLVEEVLSFDLVGHM